MEYLFTNLYHYLDAPEEFAPEECAPVAPEE